MKQIKTMLTGIGLLLMLCLLVTNNALAQAPPVANHLSASAFSTTDLERTPSVIPNHDVASDNTDSPTTSLVNDRDNDGIANTLDCAPNNPNIPAAPGTACNDNNPHTKNDRILSDGCTCIGTLSYTDNTMLVNLGPDKPIARNQSVTLTAFVDQQTSCTTTECNQQSQLIAQWNRDEFSLFANQNPINDIESNTTSTAACASFTPRPLYRNTESQQVAATSNSLRLDMPTTTQFQNDHPQALRFDIVVNPDQGTSRITQVQFKEKGLNNAPTKYGIRILKGGEQIYKAIDMPVSTTTARIALFDFSNEPVFQVTSTAIFTVELLAYDPANPQASATNWQVEDIEVYGDCCTTTSSYANTYRWSNGATTPSITVSQPGTYQVVVTDCNGVTVTDEILVYPTSQANEGIHADGRDR